MSTPTASPNLLWKAGLSWRAWLAAVLLSWLTACSAGEGGSTTTPPPPLPTIAAFTATPASITAGQSTTLAWSVTGATSLSIAPAPGVVTGTSLTLSPAATTTYTLTASNAAGSTTATVAVTVVPLPAPPVISAFNASPATLTAGQSTTLAWSVTAATSLSIAPAPGVVTGTSLTLSPAATTTYTLTASNAAGSTTATVAVTVVPAPVPPVISAFTASPATVTAGQSTTLAWLVTGAASLGIAPVPGVVTGTSLQVRPATTTTFTLTATNAAGSATATVSVTVEPAPVLPVISTFSVTPAGILAGQSATLSWSVTGASTMSLSPGLGIVTGTSATVSPAASTVYVLTARNAAGSVEATTTLTVSPAGGTANCSRTTTGFTPIDDLGAATYRGRQGGLYPGGFRQRPSDHERAGLALAQGIVPRNASGAPDPAGRYAFISIGMSNTTAEFQVFQPLAAAETGKDPHLAIVDGAQGGWSADRIIDPAAAYWTTLDQRLAAAGVSPQQVAVAWIKQADAAPNLPFPQDADKLQGELRSIVQILHQRYPNLVLAYLSSRIYAGYATSSLNPEPYAYQSGFAVKGLIESQLTGSPELNFDPARGAVRAPWLAWGPYLWADGLMPRGDGLTWACGEFQADGTHLGAAGQIKVAQALLAFLKSDSTAREWFLSEPVAVTLSPSQAHVAPSGSVAFTATVSGTTHAGVSWSASAGTVTAGAGGTASYVAPATPGIYSVRATSQADPSQVAEATVYVEATPTPPVIGTFTASPSTITAGQSTTLAWSVTGATSVGISPGPGVVAGTSLQISPAATTTYTLTAANAAGSTTASVTVTVTAAGPLTTIDITSTAVQTGVRRFGINLATNTYYDARQLSRELVYRNPGFEGYLYQSLLRIGSATATSVTEDVPYCAWPSGFWDGGSYEVISGGSTVRSGRIASSAARTASSNYTVGLAESGAIPGSGDYLLLRKTLSGGDSATLGWWTSVDGGATLTTETADLPPGTQGTQCLRVNSAGAGQSASIYGRFDTLGTAFTRLSGSYRLQFKAKGLGGSRAVVVVFHRGATTFLSQTISLSGSWETYDLPFTANDPGLPIGMAELSFAAAQSSLLLDDVSVAPVGGDAANTTAFRDPVVAALRAFNPSIVRGSVDCWGDSFDNMIAPVFGRKRTGANAYLTVPQWDLAIGFHETLELAAAVGAEPWIIFPMTTTPAEMLQIMEYLGGASSTPYGARRAARGQAMPWTQVFSRIHLEFGNENWNPVYKGGTMAAPQAYGARGHELYAAARTSPYYAPARFDFVLGGHHANPYVGQQVSAASQAHDTISLAPYMAYQVDSFASNEQLFGPLFAEPEWWSRNPSSPMVQNHAAIRPTGKNLAVYEVNLHTTTGAISQAALDDFTPSLGAGLGVAVHMLTMVKELGIKDQVFFCLGGYSFNRDDGKTALLWGGMRDMGVTDRRRPQYLALQMLNGILEGDLLRTSHLGPSPTWNQPLMNRVQQDNCHYLQSFVLRFNGRTRVAVFNLHRTDALPINLSGADAPRGRVRIDQLTSTRLTDNNESSEVVQPRSSIMTAFDPSVPLVLPPFSLTILRPD